MRRICTKCNKEKDFDDFGYDKRYGVRSCCKKCRANQEKERRKSIGKKHYRVLSIASTYNVSKEEAKKLSEIKNCQICNIEFTINKKNTRSATGQSIDHCHQTGKVRGVICSGCNLALGHARDNIDVLKSMILYLEKAEQNQIINQ